MKSLLKVALLAFLSMLFFISCGDDEANKEEKIQTDPAYGAYIYAYTSGIVSTHDPIIVKLAEPYTGPLRSSATAPDNLLSFDPPIAGQTIWTDPSTLRFEPKEPLPGGKMYKGELNLKMLAQVKDGYETFAFQFQTIKQDISVYVDGFESYSTTDLSKMMLKGQVMTADIASTEMVQAALRASQEGTERKVDIASKSSREFSFTIENIKRGEERSELKLAWNLPSGNDKVEGSKTISVPSLSDFEVLNVNVERDLEQKVTVYFSDPIQNQNLDAIITIEDVASLQFLIDGNKVEIFPDTKVVGQKLLTIDAAVKNVAGRPIPQSFTQSIAFEMEKPAVRNVADKSILPSQDKGLVFPFEAVSLEAVDVYITKIFANNVLQYLQENEFGGSYNLSRVGRHIYRKKIDLRAAGGKDLHTWNRYYIDLGDVIDVDPGALYEVDIRFKQDYAMYGCEKSSDPEMANLTITDEGWISDGTYFVDDYWNNYEYDWEQRDNPCNAAFYSQWQSRAQKTVMATNLGITAKMGGNKELLVVVNDIRSTKPIKGANFQVYDYQQQLLAEAKSDGNGFATIKCAREPFAVVATSGKEKTYLRVDQGTALSLSKFEVAGSRVQDGIKGFIYGERGVWRPGDSLYLNFILEDAEDILPKKHPVTMELWNPRGQMVSRMVKTSSVDGFYDFRTATESEAPTGDYRVNVSVGNRNYSDNLKIETVKPNRLKIAFEFDNVLADAKTLKGALKAAWLHGAPAGNLRADVMMTLKPTITKFDKFDGYNFDNNILSEFYADDEQVFDGQLNAEGETQLAIDMAGGRTDNAPGMLKASFNTKVYETGGNFSVDFHSINYAPYASFAGIKLPESDLWGNALETEKKHLIDVVNVSANGKPTDRKELIVKVFRINRRWWYDQYNGNHYNYLSSNNYNEIKTDKVKLTGGKGKYEIEMPKESWGRYLIQVEDPVSGHSAAQFVYFDWPYWMRANRSDSEASTVLGFSSDKEKYNVGESVKLTFPSPDNGRALICIENGTKVLEKYWVETVQGETQFEFKTTPEMAPNVFAHISLLQPHAQTVNDRPIRMFGLVPIPVEDPKSKLEPVITAPDVLRPESIAKISVSEADGRAMTYTLAVVDEGLLGLTRYKTPNPWNAFYAKEALGVQTWDMYDQVVGAFTDGSGNVLSIGGDDDATDPSKQKAMRFKPVVRYLGPFTLAAGKKATHEIDIPNYVGAVRVMVVAGKDEAYGNAEKEIPVRSPVMVLGTLPRVLGPGEKVSLPVNVFAMEKQVKNVTVKLKTNDLLSVSGAKTKEMKFTNIGDDVVYFELTTGMKTGLGKVSIEARSGNNVSVYEVEIDVRAPNPMYTKVTDIAIQPGETWDGNFEYFGIEGSNHAVLELSKLPAINLQERLGYLIRYPHGCIEQTTSGAFPQIYLSRMMDLRAGQKAEIDQNVMAALNKYRNFQQPNGGFSYWPGNDNVSDWGTTYTGHFMLEAEAMGYALPTGLKSQWVRYQKNAARSWSSQNNRSQPYRQREQAYRLYTLALAGQTDFGAMNLLKMQAALHISARWVLALAYIEAGQKEVAESLIKGQVTDIPQYTELSYTYGSDTRDEAFVLQTLVKLKMENDAAKVAKRIAERLGSRNWYSTQTIAYSLRGLAEFMGKGRSDGLKATISQGGKPKEVATGKSLIQEDLDKTGNAGSVSVKNNSGQVLFGRLLVSGKPLESKEERIANNLRMDIKYLDLNYNPIDVSNLKMGTNFIAEIRVVNPGSRGDLEEMALTQTFPSGWEILNERMGDGSALESSTPEYQDIRDDKVLTYFDIGYAKSLTFRLRLNAAYAGRYYMPAVKCNAMYDESILAVEQGKWIDVRAIEPAATP